MLKTDSLKVRLSTTHSGGSLPAVKQQIAHPESCIKDIDGLGRLANLDALSRNLFLTACCHIKGRLGKVIGFLLPDSRRARSDSLPGRLRLGVRFQSDADAIGEGQGTPAYVG
jgi:hypothetical protein